MNEAMKDWKQCDTRGPWIKNSLKHEIKELRRVATRSRNAYTKDFMGEPCRWYADALDEAANVLQAKLDGLSEREV